MPPPIEPPPAFHQAALPDGIFVTDNRKVRLTVAPAHGRVVSLVPAEAHRDLIWINPSPDRTESWPNWGGDKLWPASQTVWTAAYGRRWPPDDTIDGQPWRIVASSSDTLTMESRTSPELGVIASRTLRLADESACVHWTNRLTQIHPRPYPVQVWTVTQVPPPRRAWLGCQSAGDWVVITPGQDVQPLPVYDSPLQAWDLPLDRPTRWKVGTMGGWLAVAIDDRLFIQVIRSRAYSITEYPERSRLQLFACADYVELEILSPSLRLSPGQSLESQVDWVLLPIPPSTDPAIILRKWLDRPADRSLSDDTPSISP